jgi:hypothetical protein
MAGGDRYRCRTMGNRRLRVLRLPENLPRRTGDLYYIPRS